MLKEKGQKEAVQLADTFCREARVRISELFRNLYGPNDDNMYKLAMSVLKGEHAWLEHGIADGDKELGLTRETGDAEGAEEGRRLRELAGTH
jgi:hypothetical protein